MVPHKAITNQVTGVRLKLLSFLLLFLLFSTFLSFKPLFTVASLLIFFPVIMVTFYYLPSDDLCESFAFCQSNLCTKKFLELMNVANNASRCVTVVAFRFDFESETEYRNVFLQ